MGLLPNIRYCTTQTEQRSCLVWRAHSSCDNCVSTCNIFSHIPPVAADTAMGRGGLIYCDLGVTACQTETYAITNYYCNTSMHHPTRPLRPSNKQNANYNAPKPWMLRYVLQYRKRGGHQAQSKTLSREKKHYHALGTKAGESVGVLSVAAVNIPTYLLLF